MRRIVNFSLIALFISVIGYLCFNNVFSKANDENLHSENLDPDLSLEEESVEGLERPDYNTHLYKTTYKDVPTDNSLPSDYDGYDNLAFLMQNLLNKGAYETISEGSSKSGFAKVKVYGKKYVTKEESLFTSISDGIMSSAIQKYFKNGKAYVRYANKGDIDGFNTVFSTDEPTVYDKEGYLEQFGFMPQELTPYIVCEETILSMEPLQLLDNGLYELKITLNPDANYAPYYYQYDIKNNSGSKEFPFFKSIVQTYTFTKDWHILALNCQEEYQVKVFINANAKTNYTEVFKYQDLEIDLEAQKYFLQYVK